MNVPKPVLTIVSVETGRVVSEIYALNPGQTFPNFGGSRHGLTVRKTASLIVRNTQAGCITDTEYNVDDGHVWAWLARLITDKSIQVTAKGPEGAEG